MQSTQGLYFQNVYSSETFPSFHEHETIDIDVLSQEEFQNRRKIPTTDSAPPPLPKMTDPTETPWYTISAEQVAQQCNTNIETGLTEEEVKKRLQQFGKNELAKKAKIRPLRILLHHTFTFMNSILLLACILSVVVQSWEDVGILGL